MSSGHYAGDLEVGEVWNRLADDPRAVLVDVRTRAEWSFVGLPDLRPLGKAPVLIEWQSYPAMGVNPGFVQDLGEELARLGAAPDAPVFFLCRSGVRSQAAAAAATAAGHTAAFNVAGGFEGPVGPDGHRGAVAGWKASGLPWVQS
jgi:rhodanese-related sulfurtransferase